MKLNCDLGEGEPAARGRGLLACVHAANIACGGHAGDARTMDRYVRWCQEFRVLLGAHPGPWSRADHGRSAVELSPDELELLLIQQVGGFEKVARHHGLAMHHIKLHGGLYHASEREPVLARAYVRIVAKWWPRVRIIAFAAGRVARAARRAGVLVWEEAFADRAYQDDGKLVPRDHSQALLNVSQALVQAHGLMEERQVRTIQGRRRIVRAQTLCLHSDTPGALRIARALRSV